MTQYKVAISLDRGTLKRLDCLVRRSFRTSLRRSRLSVERLGGRIGEASPEEITQIIEGLNEIVGE